MNTNGKFNEVTDAVRELSELTKGCESHVTDLLLAAAALSELLESYDDRPRSGGGRPLRWMNWVWEDAADRIVMAQTAAKSCAADLLTLLPEIEYCAGCADEALSATPADTAPEEAEPLRRKYEEARRTLEQYAEEIQAAKEKQAAAEDRCSKWTDVYADLFEAAAGLMSDEERERHLQFRQKCFTGKFPAE